MNVYKVWVQVCFRLPFKNLECLPLINALGGCCDFEVGRIALGEEVDFAYVASTLKVAIEEYNHCITSLRKKLAEPEAMLNALASQAPFIGEDGGELIEKTMTQMTNKIAALKEISLQPADGILINLVVPNRNVVLVKKGTGLNILI